MHWRDIPKTIFIGRSDEGETCGEELWTVRWRKATDETWVRPGKKRFVGLCDFANRTIHLDERLKHNPTELRDTWVHELAHASLMYWLARPRSFNAKREEKLISALAPVLARALAQSDPRRSVRGRR